MSKKLNSPNVKVNYIYSVLYQLLLVLVPIITAPYLTRKVGAEQLGVYSYTNSIAHYFYLFAMLGMQNYGNRCIAQARDNQKLLSQKFSEMITLQLIWGVVVIFCYSIYLVALLFMHSPFFISSLIWGLYIISGTIDISWFFWGIEFFKITVLRNIIIKIFTTIGIFTLIKSPNELNLYIFLIAGSSILTQAILWLNVKKYIKYEKPSMQRIKVHIKPNLLLFLPVIAVSIYTIMDKIMLGKWGTMEQLGFYDNVQKIMTIPTGLITALGTVMLPRMSNLFANKNKDIAMQYLSISMQFSCFFAIPFMFGILAIAPLFVPIYFGQGYDPCINMMELFSVTILFISWANVIRTQFLIPSEKDKIYLGSVIVGAIVNVIANIILIPIYNATGAIIGTICAEFSVALLQTVCVRYSLPVIKYIKESIFFLIPGLLMLVATRFFIANMSTTVTTLILAIVLGACIYLLTGITVLKFTKSNLSAYINSFVSLHIHGINKKKSYNAQRK